MLSCRDCPILWMIPCYLYELPPSRYFLFNSICFLYGLCDMSGQCLLTSRSGLVLGSLCTWLPLASQCSCSLWELLLVPVESDGCLQHGCFCFPSFLKPTGAGWSLFTLPGCSYTHIGVLSFRISCSSAQKLFTDSAFWISFPLNTFPSPLPCLFLPAHALQGCFEPNSQCKH